MARRKRGRELSGFLLLDKPSGPTSNQILQRIRRLFDARKAGHTGTLDPLATGMLPICFGAATRTASYAIAADKHYEATGRLGIGTDTGDAMGEVVERAEVPTSAADEISAACGHFVGEIEQVPPRYSAVHHEGRRLYELARAGVTVDVPARSVTIHSLDLLAVNDEEFSIRVHCSKGTYIRTLVEDIGRRLGLPAHVTRLRRTAVDPFTGLSMVTPEQVESAVGSADGADHLLLPVDCVLQHWPRVELDFDAAARLCAGQKIGLNEPLPPGRYRVYRGPGEFVGIGEISAAAELVPKRIFL